MTTSTIETEVQRSGQSACGPGGDARATGRPDSTAEPPGERWTWEQAVAWLRAQPDQAELVRNCYFDDPLLDAARRFAGSDEFRETATWLPAKPGRALDLGAGRGIGSFALAKLGWRVTAVEPDPSALVGAAAIRTLAREGGVNIEIVEEEAEVLPFPDDSFDLVYARQALHHAGDLSDFLLEAARVLRPGGRFVATREHVISRDEDLPAFLQSHPLHRFYGGECAYKLDDYLGAIQTAGLTVRRVIGPFDSVVNYFPESKAQWRNRCRRVLARWTGDSLARVIADDRHAPGRAVLRRIARRLSANCHTPGRMFSFVADKGGNRLATGCGTGTWSFGTEEVACATAL